MLGWQVEPCRRWQQNWNLPVASNSVCGGSAEHARRKSKAAVSQESDKAEVEEAEEDRAWGAKNHAITTAGQVCACPCGYRKNHGGAVLLTCAMSPREHKAFRWSGSQGPWGLGYSACVC